MNTIYNLQVIDYMFYNHSPEQKQGKVYQINYYSPGLVENRLMMI